MPTPSQPPAEVTLHALSCGHFTLPSHQFIAPCLQTDRTLVPSLAFLIQHHSPQTGKTTRLLFDLGLRRDITEYSAPIQKHIETRRPISTEPDVVERLTKGGLAPEDIDVVILSHVHWDHIGQPRAFPTSFFVVGHGSPALLDGAHKESLRGGHSFFERDLLPRDRTIELSDPDCSCAPEEEESHTPVGNLSFHRLWKSAGAFLPQTLDIFGDGSVLIVNAPGHLPGHINLLVRLYHRRAVYLAGDACHDRRLLTGEKMIAEWDGESGQRCCMHADRPAAEATLERIKGLVSEGVEVIFAHDVEWEKTYEAERGRFFGAGP